MESENGFMSSEVQFWLFLTALIPSALCSICIICYILSNVNRRQAIHNHVVVLLLINNLIYELTNISLFLNYYRLGTVYPASKSLCLTWAFIDEALYSVSTITVAWASIERHILVFHSSWLITARQRFLLHYLPITLLISYILIFHFIVIIFPPCVNTYDFTAEICGHPLCFHNTKLVGTWDTIANDIVPALIIVMFSISLLIRVLLKNRRVRKSLQWRKHKKMAIQLLSISSLYFILYIPVMSIELANLCCISGSIGGLFKEYAQFFSYYVILLLPFVYLLPFVENPYKLQNIRTFICRSQQAVGPMSLPTIHNVPNRPNELETMT